MPSNRDGNRCLCPVAGVLDLLGDRWTLLVVRDCFLGKTRFGDFAASPEGIPTNLLTDRLKRLEAAGILERVPYQQNPVRYDYHLTDKGRELGNVLGSIIAWGKKHLPETTEVPDDIIARFRP